MIKARLSIKTPTRLSVRKVEASSKTDLYLMIGAMKSVEGCEIPNIVII